MKKTIEIKEYISKEKEGTYFTIPFDVPEDVEQIDIEYTYTRRVEVPLQEPFFGTKLEEINIVDLGVQSPERFVGASGSDRNHIWVREIGSADGYASLPITKGKWAIIVGAYKIQPEGLNVDYKITFTKKHLRLFAGDTHMHSTGSDGVYSVAQLANKAKDLGLDFIVVTDHNNYAHNFEITGKEPVTVIPGCEFTHYKGHANLYGVKMPLINPLDVNTTEEMQEKLKEAKKNNAIVSINHPFCPYCGWRWGLENTSFDMVEVWNGAVSDEYNKKALDWWQQQLAAGKKIAVVSGSDYHRTEKSRELSQPTIYVWALSNSQADILKGMSNGASFITYEPNGPQLEVSGALFGSTIEKPTELNVRFKNLKPNDTIKIIYDGAVEEVVCENGVADGTLKIKPVAGNKFIRFEVYRGTSQDRVFPILISNPIYFK